LAVTPKDIPPAFLSNGLGKRSEEGHERHERDRDDHREKCEERTGKISGLIFDRCGDFEGFILNTVEGEHRFFSREADSEPPVSFKPRSQPA
jgi:hypothetical protein